MKEYFDLMNKEIQREKGTIIKYMGDEIMVLFGAPLPLEEHAARACRAALRMQEVLDAKRPVWNREGKPEVRIGIGIHTGPMLVGIIGSSERYEYGAIGDNVNLASRIQGLTKDYQSPIIISEDTAKLAGDAFQTRKLDCVKVRGRSTEITIFELIGNSGRISP